MILYYDIIKFNNYSFQNDNIVELTLSKTLPTKTEHYNVYYRIVELNCISFSSVDIINYKWSV